LDAKQNVIAESKGKSAIMFLPHFPFLISLHQKSRGTNVHLQHVKKKTSNSFKVPLNGKVGGLLVLTKPGYFRSGSPGEGNTDIFSQIFGKSNFYR
jgi:hypothetical protein